MNNLACSTRVNEVSINIGDDQHEKWSFAFPLYNIRNAAIYEFTI